jgi:hypothetical protein
VSAPALEGKPKKVHFQKRVVHALDQKQIQARPIRFDGWYASAEKLKVIHRRKRTFFTPLKSNRWVSLSKEPGSGHVEDLEGTPARRTSGVLVKVKEVPFTGRFFKRVAPEGALDWVMTKDREETLTAPVAAEASDGRWQVEELPRGLKHLTGTEKCQGRAARAQRNHLACCYHAWGS